MSLLWKLAFDFHDYSITMFIYFTFNLNLTNGFAKHFVSPWKLWSQKSQFFKIINLMKFMLLLLNFFCPRWLMENVLCTFWCVYFFFKYKKLHAIDKQETVFFARRKKALYVIHMHILWTINNKIINIIQFDWDHIVECVVNLISTTTTTTTSSSIKIIKIATEATGKNILSWVEKTADIIFENCNWIKKKNRGRETEKRIHTHTDRKHGKKSYTEYPILNWNNGISLLSSSICLFS